MARQEHIYRTPIGHLLIELTDAKAISQTQVRREIGLKGYANYERMTPIPDQYIPIIAEYFKKELLRRTDDPEGFLREVNEASRRELADLAENAARLPRGRRRRTAMIAPPEPVFEAPRAQQAELALVPDAKSNGSRPLKAKVEDLVARVAFLERELGVKPQKIGNGE